MTEQIEQARARIGASGWKKPMWRGEFYPKGLVQKKELEFASRELRTLEINNTFHGSPSLANFATWRAETPDDFVFAVKGSKIPTHLHKLEDPLVDLAYFFSKGSLTLEEKLGPFLWQLPPYVRFDRDVVGAFLAALPHSVAEARQLVEEHRPGVAEQASLDVPDRALQHSFEARHHSFADDPTFLELLRQHHIAAVFSNSPDATSFAELTSDFVYLRLHAAPDHFPDGYPDDELERWAQTIRGWTSGSGATDGRPREVYVYFNRPDNNGFAQPIDAHRLQALLS
jgi:uncharacterized protein YecE (DUF72 family)